MMPPAVCALLVLFNRNHNYIAQKILDINERGTFERDIAKLDSGDADKKRAQDDEIFERARLVNTGFFMQVILGGESFPCGLLRASRLMVMQITSALS